MGSDHEGQNPARDDSAARVQSQNQVTQLLARASDGDRRAWEVLMPLLESEMRLMAMGRLRHQRGQGTLQATMLVNDACLRLLGDREQQWANRAQFFAAAARAMKNMVVDAARRRGRLKRGGGGGSTGSGSTGSGSTGSGSNRRRRQVTLSALSAPAPLDGADLLALDGALAKLAGAHPRAHDVILLRFFAGLDQQEAARAMGLSLATVERLWSFARAWLHRELSSGEEAGA